MSTRQFIVTERYDDTGDEYHGWREVEREEIQTPGAWITREQLFKVLFEKTTMHRRCCNETCDELFPPKSEEQNDVNL